MIKIQVMKLTNTMTVLISATVSASRLSSLAFSPRDFAHNLQYLFLIYFLEAEYACPPKNAATIAATDTKYVAAISPSILLAPSNPIQSASTTENG